MEEILKQLAIANANQQQTNAGFQRSLAAQQQAHQESIAGLEQRHQQQMEAIVKQLQRQQTEAGSQASNIPTFRVSHLLPKMTADDDPEMFLTRFERTAEKESWPKEQWAGLVAPLLAGEAQKAYFDLELEDAKNYDRLKVEILARFGVTLDVRAQRVHNWSYQLKKPPRSQMYDLIHLAKKWLQPEILSGPKILERVVMDKFLRSLPNTLQKWVSHGGPETADKLVDLVERYLTTENLTSFSRDAQTFHPKTRPSPPISKTASGDGGGERIQRATRGISRTTTNVWRERPGRPIPQERTGRLICYRCREEGHVAAVCPAVCPVDDEPMHCDFLTERRQSFFATTCTAVKGNEKPLYRMCLEGKDVVVLLDSGNLVTLVKK